MTAALIALAVCLAGSALAVFWPYCDDEPEIRRHQRFMAALDPDRRSR